ncbi:MAG: hypothetical protein F6K26_28085 [Moorea sp. SIO2I5]|nr:hypothetical protein [Moorena sp. SIO2I5]
MPRIIWQDIIKNKKLTIRITDFEKRQPEQDSNPIGMTITELIRSLIALSFDPCIPCPRFIREMKP